MGPGQGLEGGSWSFIEGKPAQRSPENLSDGCNKWFCNPSNFFGNKTEVFAVQYEQTELRVNKTRYYPMAWDPENKNVPGINRTQFYQKVCRACVSNETAVER